MTICTCRKSHILPLYYCAVHFLDAWLGDPSGEKVFIHGYSQHRVRAVEGLSADPTKMALALLDVFFTKEQLGRSLVTNKDGRDLLDPNIIERIR